MRKFLILLTLLLCLFLCCCDASEQSAQIAATTLPVYEFTQSLCNGTNISVTRLINEEISCLHNYTLQTKQMRAVENAQVIVVSGSGLEDFLADIDLTQKEIIDASNGIESHYAEDSHEQHHKSDPHIWLSPMLAKQMAENIYQKLCNLYPDNKDIFTKNHNDLNESFDKLREYAEQELRSLSCRKMMTFHDGFSYMADSFGLTIVHAVEEESGSEASAAELIEMIRIVEENELRVLFTERFGSTAAATIVAEETDSKIYQLDMAIAGDSYFDAMYKNIDTIKEALE